MDRSMGTLVAFVAVVLLLAGPAAAVFDGYDGLPRPNGTEYKPTTTYGPKPSVKYNNKAANCIWYGWENVNYDEVQTKRCSSLLWSSLSASNPAGLSAYMYYVPQDNDFYDPQYNEYLCAIGCFVISAAGSPGHAPSLAPVAPPPTVVTPAAVEPPTEATPPPSPVTIAPPPPATLFQPPPPAVSEPPTSVPPVATPTGSVPSPVSTPSSTSPALSPPAFGPSRAVAPGPFVFVDSAATTTVASSLLIFAVTLVLSINVLA